MINCFFRTPKYKLGEKVCIIVLGGEFIERHEEVRRIYKDYRHNAIFYEVINEMAYSESLLDYYKEQKDRNEN